MGLETGAGGSGAGILYVAASPLGNLGDVSHRLERVLREVAVVAAEDTRRTRKLLSHLDAHPRLLSYHAHSEPGREEELMRVLEDGESVALVTDAGTPAVSDPGSRLVARARATGVHVVPIPGPSAVIAALSVSGLSADRFTFLGFLPRGGAERRRMLATVRESPWTVVLFEAANRLAKLLRDLIDEGLADRHGAVARELTKVHEEVQTGTLVGLEGYYRDHPARGEVTVVVTGGPAAVRKRPPVADHETVAARARQLVREGASRRDAAARLAQELNLSRNDAYRVVASL